MNPEKIGKNIAKLLLMEEITESVALYPGAFKPPHKGHVDAILKSINFAMNHDRKINGPSMPSSTQTPGKAIVFVSEKTRENVDYNESLAVWDLYKEVVPELNNVEFISTPTPVKAVYDYVKENPTHDIKAVFGKGEESRYERLLDKEKYPTVELFDAGTFQDLSATDLRRAIVNKDREEIKKFIPDGVDVNKFLDIFNSKSSSFNEAIVGDKIECDNCGWSWDIVDGGDDLFICHKCGHDNSPSSLKSKLNEGWEPQKAKIINKFLHFASDFLKTDRPQIKLLNGPEFTQTYHSFGGYHPGKEYIQVVVYNRNMADILRTLAHEMVHRMQHLDNRLGPNSGEDGSPEENEANSLAAVIMRKFGRENPGIYE
tara:strand:- start:707 stop:1822 length:1116 start_codon:yes stop_codon:yes gene_type:complete